MAPRHWPVSTSLGTFEKGSWWPPQRPPPRHPYHRRMLSQHDVIAPHGRGGTVSVLGEQKPSLHIAGGKGLMRPEGAMPTFLGGMLQCTLERLQSKHLGTVFS